MKYLLSVVLCCFFFLLGCSGKNEKKEGEQSVRRNLNVGLVFDVGGRGDKSFNDSAYNGLELAQKKHGIQYTYVEPQGEGADRESALRQMAADPDVDLVIGVGLLFSDDITRIALEFPDKKFACVDYIAQPNTPVPSNLQGIVFDEKGGSYVAESLKDLSPRPPTSKTRPTLRLRLTDCSPSFFSFFPEQPRRKKKQHKTTESRYFIKKTPRRFNPVKDRYILSS